MIIDSHFPFLEAESVLTLERTFTVNDVWDTVKSCDGSKSPSPDGFNLEFIQTN